MIVVQADLAGAEFSVTGYCANDPDMIRIHKEGLSPHEVSGSNMSGLPIDIIKKENKYLEDNSITDPNEIELARKEFFPEILEAKWYPRISSIRQASKKAVHSGNYGIQYKAFALSNEMPEAEAKMLLDLYRKKNFKRLLPWYDEIKQELKDNGRVLTNCFGRKVRLLGAWNPSLFNQAYAFKGQSTIGDITRQCLAAIYKDDYPSEMLSQVHDSVMFQLPENAHALDNAAYISKVAFAETHLRPPLHYSGHDFFIEADAKVGYNLGKKGALGLTLSRDVDKMAEDLKECLEKLNE